MREKIKELSKGRMVWKQPELLLSETGLCITVEAGGTYRGDFTIKNGNHTGVRGVVYSDRSILAIKDPLFAGIENMIAYEVRAGDLGPGESCRGAVTVVSDCGEKELPFTITAQLPWCGTSMGKIRDLFHFANLAKSDWMEAVKLFKSEKFERVLLKRDVKNSLIYHSLIKSVSTSQAMEEFLTAVHKKLRINFTVDKTEVMLEAGTETVMDKLVISRDGWGHAEIHVSSDAPFLIPDHKIIWSDNFIGSRYVLEFVADPAKMRPGRNFGHLYLKTAHQTIPVLVTARLLKNSPERSGLIRRRQECEAALIRTYLDFRMNRIHVKEYASGMEAVLKRLEGLCSDAGERPDNLFSDLIRIHICIADGRTERARILLNRIEALDPEENGKIAEYSAWLYLRALFTREPADIEEACEKIRGYYSQGVKDWKLLWYLLYLDKKYTANRKKKLEDLEEHLREGCHSPVLYLEAASVYNEDPSLLKNLDGVSARVADWAVREDYLSREAAMQFTYLSTRQRSFHPLIFRSLGRLYEKHRSREALTAAVSLLIKGQKTGERYLPWYRKGVEEQLRVTELNEYYMYSTREDSKLVLPQPLLHYFVFNSTLGDRKKACLYASIINGREENPAAYESYKKLIDRFARKQLQEGNISESLAVIYEDFIRTDTLDEEIAGLLPNVMFCHELYCTNPAVTGVYVVHKELLGEQYVPLENGRAQVDIFTESAQIFLTDEQGGRYVCTMDYTLNKLLNLDDLAPECYRLSCRDLRLLLHLAEQNENYQKSQEDALRIKGELLESDAINRYYKGKWSVSMIHYCYDSFDGERLEELLRTVDLEEAPAAERPDLIEFMIIRDLDKTAMEQIRRYGYERIGVKRLLRLWTRQAAEQGMEEKDELLTGLGYFIFQSGKYNETLLRYLIRFFDGTTRQMYQLWKAARGFDMETAVLEERLLAQMLFAQSGGTRRFPVFFSYYPHGGDKKLIRAFLNCSAYKYLLNDRVLPPELFEILKKEIRLEENETGMLALLKYYSGKSVLTEEEAGLADYLLQRFLEKGRVLPFFKELNGKVPVPFSIVNRFYVEYRTDPSKKVTIHYLLDNEEGREDFTSEPMTDVFGGIFVRAFVLFYNETLQYYITEEEPGGEIIVESNTVTAGGRPEEEENRYTLINLMLMAGEMQDEKTLFELMETFIKTEYALDTLFCTI